MGRLGMCMMVCAAVLASGAARQPWVCYEVENLGADYEITAQTADSYTMTVRRTDGKNPKAWGLAITDVNRTMWTQNKLVFSVRGLNSRPIEFTPTVSYVSGNRVVMKSAKSFKVAGRTWRHYVLGLDTDFGLGDCGLEFKQIKLGLNVTAWREGDEGGVEVKNVRMCAPSEVTIGGGSGADEFYAVPSDPGRDAARPARPEALRVYFSLDNEDVVPSVHVGKKGLEDAQQFGGFREVLLEALDGAAVVETDLSRAEVIVYSRCRADAEEASRIAAAVRERGVPLLAASEIADEAVASLLPCELSARASEDYAPRSGLRFTAAGQALERLGGYSEATFGKYRAIALRGEGRALMTFGDGTPLLVEGRSGKGRVLYSMLGLGTDAVPGKASQDAFLVRLLGYLSGRALPERTEEPVRPDADGWWLGASEGNFGRFGWEVGSGLLVEELGRHLSVTKGICEYSFGEEKASKVTLPQWRFTGLDGAVRRQVWSTSWQDIGVVTLETQVTIPSAWRRERVYFHVEKGIDDTAAVYVNGVKVGEVTQETPQYWMTTHRHRVPSDIIRFDQPNDIRIVTENLRGSGSFGSCPEMVVDTPPKTVEFAVDRCGHLGIGGSITVNGRRLGRMDASLAFPGTRWRFEVPRISMNLYNVLGHAAVPTAEGARVLDMRGLRELPTDGTAPWLLLFTGEAGDSPLLLVRERRLSSIEVIVNGDVQNGLTLVSSEGPVGAVIPVWLYGSELVDTSSWRGGLPAEVLERVRFWYPRALMVPVQAEERFRLDTSSGRVEIRDRFEYAETADEWGTERRPYAPVPPLAYYTHDFFGAGLSPDGGGAVGTGAAGASAGKRLFAGEAGIVDRGLVTRFGPYADVDGSREVRWSLPLPEPNLGLLPHTLGFESYDRLANEQFASGVRYSCGGGVPVEAHNKAYPRGTGQPDVWNWNMHGALLGMCRCTPNPFVYTAENRRLMRRRMLWRMLEPLETHQHKMVTRWRREPFSGIRYTIYMNSPRDIVTRYRPETYGSKIIYGDSNETVRMILTCLQKLADQAGQADVVKANWNAIRRQVALYPLVLDDWGYLASGCLEYGGACCIDMLNNEYSSLCALARLAEIAGDEAMRQQALYRAARRMVPTLARLRIRDYYVAHGLLGNPESWSISTGFTESGASFRQRGGAVRDVELFDMSQGIPRDLIGLYEWFGWEELRRGYLDDVLKADGTRGQTYIMAAILAIGGDQSDAELRAYLDACTRLEKLNKWLPTDWPGMDTGSYLEFVYHRLAGSPLIADCRDLTLHDAVFDPASGELRLDVTPGARPALAVRTGRRLLAPQTLSQDADGLIRLPLAGTGRRTITLAFEKP